MKLKLLLPLMFGFFVMGFGDIIGTVMNQVKAECAANAATISWMMPIFAYCWFLLISVPTGVLCGRIGRKNAVLLSLAITAAAMFVPLAASAERWGLYIVSFALIGIGNTIIQAALPALLSNVVDKDQITSRISLGQFVKAVCAALTPVAVYLTATALGNWKLLFPLYGGLTILETLWLWFTRLPDERRSGRTSPAAQTSFASCFAMLKNPYVLAMTVGIFFSVGADVGFAVAIPDYLKNVFRVDVDRAGMGPTVYFVAKTVAAFLGAVVFAKVSAAKCFPWCMGIGILATAAIWFVGSPFAFLACIFVVALMTANSFGMCMGLAINRVPEKANEITALMVMAIVGGGVVSAVFAPVQAAFGPAGIVGALVVCIGYLFVLGLMAASKSGLRPAVAAGAVLALAAVVGCLSGDAYDKNVAAGMKTPAPYALTVEYRDEPVGIDAARPRFAWKLPAGVVRQTAYEIEADGWRSGRVVSDETVGAEWKGPALPSSTRIGWRVRVWNEKNEVGAWSARASFVTALMAQDGWKAKWIGPAASTRGDEDMKGAKWITGVRDAKGAITLRKTFDFAGAADGEFVEMVHAACPLHEIRINGKNCHLPAGHVHRWNFLQFRDITDWLVKGRNTIEVKVLAGREKDAAFLAKFTLPGGRTFVTDGSWEGARELGDVRSPAFAKDLVLRTETRSPAFEKAFDVRKPLRSAILHVTGVGFYEASLNGARVGDKVLDPAPTDYDERVLYSTYDVGPSLKAGRNVLKVLVGHGWYDVRSIATWDFDTAPWRDFPRMIAQLELTYLDGTRETVVSDGSWRHVDSPVRYDCIREGEVVSGDGTGRAVGACAVVKGPRGRLVAEALPGAKVMRTIEPEWIRSFGNGVYVVAFPENFAGWIRATFRGQKKGDTVVIRYDERVNEDGSPAERSVNDGIHSRRGPVDVRKAAKGEETRRIDCHFRYTASHRVAAKGAEFQADRLIASGKAAETYEPRFTYNGFRYVVLKGLRQAPRKEDIVGCVVHTAFRDIGSFTCSDETFNTLMTMAARSYKSNFVDGYPTDCPHREKNGWTGDASIASELAQYLFENTAAYEKWLQDLCDTQLPSGDICCIVPTSGWGFVWGNGPAWDSALPVIAWNLYNYRNDRRILELVYPVLKRYLAFTAAKADAGGLVKHGLGDWIPVSTMPATELTSSCYYYQALSIASEMAHVLGLPGESALYAATAGATRRAINAKYYRGDGVYDNGGQTAQAFPLAFGVADSSEREKVAAKLVEAVERRDCHVDMGLLGTKHVFRALSRIGRTDLAFRMLVNPTKPSMVEWIQKGGTTLWEDWGDGASRNHIMFGDFAGWAYQYLAGIGLPEKENSTSAVPRVKARGFREVVFAPCVIDALNRVEATVDTPYGVYASRWTRRDGTVRYTFTVPPGCRATIRLAGREDETVGPGTHCR